MEAEKFDFELRENLRPRLSPTGRVRRRRTFRAMLRSLYLSTTLFFHVKILEGLVLRRKIREFYLLLGGHIFFQTLAASVQFDLFTFLAESGGASAEEIARKLGIAEQPCRILLLGLTSLGLIHRSGKIYRNGLMARTYLSKTSPKNIINIVLWQHFINYRALFHFFESLRMNANVGLREFPGRGETLYERLQDRPELEQIFQNAMEDISTQSNRAFAKHVDLSGIRWLVDVGGGNGSNILQLAELYPELRATVFDSASVCEIAKQNFNRSRHADRLGVAVGDCFADPFPQADGILFCHFFTIWSKEENLKLLKKAYSALPRGGQAMIFNMMQDDSAGGPMSAAMGSPYFLTLATGRGMLYTWNEYIELFRAAGFTNVTVQKLPFQHGCITGYKD